jgi:hypothetical protein
MSVISSAPQASITGEAPITNPQPVFAFQREDWSLEILWGLEIGIWGFTHVV